MRKMIICLGFLLLPFALNAQKAAQKTNAVYWLTGTPNIGLEFAISPKFTLEINGAYNPWDLPGKASMRHWSVHAGARFWFCRAFEGHFISLDASYADYDIGYLPFKFISDVSYRGSAYGGGISYGYHWPLGKRWGVEVTAGFGYMNLKYDKYERLNDCDEIYGNYVRHYYGPVRLGVSFIFMLK